MRTLEIVFASFLVAALGSSAARAATTTHQVQSGTGAHVNASVATPDFCVETGVVIDAATSVTKQNGGTSSGASVSLFRSDNCNGIFEFGFASIDLTNQFQTNPGNHTATLNVTIPVETFDSEGVARTRVVVANVQLQSTGDTTSGLSTSRFSGGTLRIVSSGHSVSNLANVTGQVSVDGLPFLPDGSAAGSIETSMSVSVSITK